MISTIVLGVILFIFGIIDIRHKEIPNLYFVVSAILTIGLSLFQRNTSIFNGLLGITVGIVLIIISKVTRGKIGIGDGITFCITGLILGVNVNLQMLMFALFLSAIYAIFLLIFKKVNRQHTIPFLPFVFVGYLGVLII
ncbi:prepilin peptidase [Anaeromicropila herbilytica]|uniref:Prepilin type IV endopeptidase peptidase domain-containing protein n=1 Tax=Anaeromicropila herbilytica TaxID=2785025 RepID=A0A7R7IFB9_9FIRM|nr:prepilin peptidase [Anaeromicropila herbilytica]BCN32931.1 hypothetical protein bsdtb5_42260 [Anaeromicropila herbilytica]